MHQSHDSGCHRVSLPHRHARAARLTGRALIGSPSGNVAALRQAPLPSHTGCAGPSPDTLRQIVSKSRGTLPLSLRGLDRFLVDHLVDQHPHVTSKRKFPCEQLEQDHAQRVDIGSAVRLVGFALGLFRRHVGGRAEDLAVHSHGDLADVTPGQAKVGDSGLIVGVDKMFCGLRSRWTTPISWAWCRASAILRHSSAPSRGHCPTPLKPLRQWETADEERTHEERTLPPFRKLKRSTVTARSCRLRADSCARCRDGQRCATCVRVPNGRRFAGPILDLPAAVLVEYCAGWRTAPGLSSVDSRTRSSWGDGQRANRTVAGQGDRGVAATGHSTASPPRTIPVGPAAAFRST